MRAPKVCQYCFGTGVEQEQAAVGHRMRHFRRNQQLTLKEMARHMGMSAACLSDLERGKRRWTRRLIDGYTEATKSR